jgi:RimJ/RimL family protein N-acetyltransferase
VTSPFELQTSRLLLRRLCTADAPPIYDYRSLPEVARYQSWSSYRLQDAESLIAQQASVEMNTAGSWLQLAIVECTTGSIAGDCGIHFLADSPEQVELGITLGTSHQGRGVAFEALNCVLDYLFGQLSKHRVTAVVDPENRPAAELFKRLGFRQEAHQVENIWFKGAWGSELTFALLSREWRV